MAHQFNEHRAHKVEKERVKHLCRGGYATGGAVHGDEAEDRKLIKKEVKSSALKEDGKKPKHRADRVKRAKGGRVKHKGHSGKTNVNVIVAPKGEGSAGGPPPMAGLAPHPMAPPPPAMAAPPPAGPPPMAAKPPMPPMGAGAPPPGMPMRKKGGRVFSDSKPLNVRGTTNSIPGPSTDQAKTKSDAAQNAKREHTHFGGSQVGRKKGGRVEAADKKGLTGIGDRTPVQHSGNKDDTQNIGRGKPITYARGGKVDQEERGGMSQYMHSEKFEGEGGGNKPAKGRKQYVEGWMTHAKPTNRATGGPIYAEGKEGKGMGPALKEGSRSGLGRLEKAQRATKTHAL